jgi:hypothetical protein
MTVNLIKNTTNSYVLGALTRFQRDSIDLVRYVCLSIRMKQLVSNLTDFHKFLYFTIFRTYIENLQVSGKNLTKALGSLYEGLGTLMMTSG